MFSADKFLGRIKKLESGCWEFVGAKNDFGYGIQRINGSTQRAHRLSYVLFKGPIPKELLVLHTCDNPACCNPEHLFVGTHKDNSDDKYNKGRDCHTGDHCRGSLNCNAILTEDDIPEIRKLIEDGYTHQVIADVFNVTRYTITDINRGKTWRHVS